jgi:small multidrug resistance pump
MGWFYLFIAILFEVIGTTQLKRTEGNFFTTAGMLMLLFYAVSFFMLTLALKNDIEVGVGYAIWSGVGTALIAIIGVMAFNEHATVMKFLCIAMIIIGVVGLKLEQGKWDSARKQNAVDEIESVDGQQPATGNVSESDFDGQGIEPPMPEMASN